MGGKNYRVSAFTLIELIIVIAILAILAVIAIVAFRNQIFKGNDAKRKADLNRIGVAAEEYEKDHNCYPPADLVVCTPVDSGLQPYLNNIPCDPITHLSYYYEPGPGSCPAWYRIFTKLENTTDASIFPGIGFNGEDNFYTGSPNAPPPYESGVVTGYWGCINRACVPVVVSSPGHPICNPTYTDPSCGTTNSCTDQQTTFPCKPI